MSYIVDGLKLSTSSKFRFKRIIKMTLSPIIKDLISFLDLCPTALHATNYLLKKLCQKHYQELSEEKGMQIEPGKHYVLHNNGSALCAFITPHLTPKRLRLYASHLDSPCLKLKHFTQVHKHQSVLLGVEVYGAPLLTSWLNRDLGLAGRIIFKDQSDQIKETLVRLEDHSFMIPQLAIHLDRQVNEQGLLLNKQEHLFLLASLNDPSINENDKTTTFLETLLQQKWPVKKLIAYDLFAYPLEKARIVGYPPSMLAGFRIDSLASVHAATTALLQESEPLQDELKMVIFWDHEEIGSQSTQGALSPFFMQIIERILASYGASRSELFSVLNRSTCISIDLAHALHPNYANKHDEQHQVLLGNGITIKHNAQHRYATNASSFLPIYQAAQLCNINLQHFVSRNDIPCGSTIGPLHASLTGMPTVDIGCPQLSMHSARELMACQDHLDMCKLLTTLFALKKWPEATNFI